MKNLLRVTGVKMVSASTADGAAGLIGWLAVELNGRLALDGLTLRKKRDGQLTISFPSRKDAAGRSHPIVRPVDDATRQSLERQVLDSLGLLEHGQRR